MKMNRQSGYINTLLLLLVLSVALLFAALGFGGWAFGSRGDYKNNSDKKAAVAAAAAVKKTQAEDAVKYAEEAKSPLKTFVGPSEFGAVTLQYPKTWSAYVIENGSNNPLDGYFHPDVVPNIGDSNNAYALRVQVLNRSYDDVVGSFSSLVNTSKLAALPYSLPKVPGVAGMRFTGQINSKQQGSVIVLPLRNVTLEISTQSADFIADLNTYILPNLTFSP